MKQTVALVAALTVFCVCFTHLSHAGHADHDPGAPNMAPVTGSLMSEAPPNTIPPAGLQCGTSCSCAECDACEGRCTGCTQDGCRAVAKACCGGLDCTCPTGPILAE
jgi:hypothetical protein